MTTKERVYVASETYNLVAGLSSATVDLSSSLPGASNVTYLLKFQTSIALSAATGDTISMAFAPSSASAPAIDITRVVAADVLINNMPCSAISKSVYYYGMRPTITATVPNDVPSGWVTVSIGNLVNPGTGDYYVQAKTSRQNGFVLSELYMTPGKVRFPDSPPITVDTSTGGPASAMYKFALRLENQLTAGGTIVFTFENADLSNVTPADCYIYGTTATVNAAARQVIFTVNTGERMASSDPFQVYIRKVRNATAGTYGLIVATSIGDSGTAGYEITAVSNYYVLTSGDDVNDGLTMSTPKKTIGAAIAAAPAGSNILVGYGTYTESVTVNKPGITIAGNYDASFQVATTKATVRPPTADATALLITANGVTIKNFIVTGASMGIKLDGASNSQIRDSTITGNWRGVQLSGTASQNRILGCDITANTNNVNNQSTGAGNQVRYCNIYGSTGGPGSGGGAFSMNSDLDASMNWWGDASGPNGPRLDAQGNPTGLLPGNGDGVSGWSGANVWCLPWLTRNAITVKYDAVGYLGASIPVMKGWNIIGMPLALDSHVKEMNTTSLGGGYTANTWGGLWDLGKREVLYTGTHTGDNNATILADDTRNWVYNELVGLTLFNVTDGSSGAITANTDKTVTATLADGTENDWDTNDAYKISDGHALKLYYTISGTERVYAPIYYWDANSKLWMQVTATTVAEPGNAYLVRMMETDSIPILFSPDKSVPSKQLAAGWNLVSYAYMTVSGLGKQGLSAAIDAALKTVERVPSAAGDVKGYSQVVSPPMNQFPWVYIPPAQGGAGGTFIAPEYTGQPGHEAEQCVMVVGRGYWVFMQNPGTLAGASFTPMSFNMEY